MSWKENCNKYAQMPKRDRIIVAVLLLGAIAYGAYYGITHFIEENKKAKETIAKGEAEIPQLNADIADLTNRLKMDPNVDYKNQEKKLKEELKLLEENIDVAIANMVPANKMPSVLSDILGRTSGLKVVSLESEEPKLLLSVGDDKIHYKLYSHGMTLNLTGDYNSLVKFVTDVENMDTKLYWQRLDYKVDSYPQSTIKLTIGTLSSNEEFISVKPTK